MSAKDEIVFNYRKGLYHSEDTVEIPDGALLSNSSNVVYTKKGKPLSFRIPEQVLTDGGTRMFTLDSDLIGMMGLDDTTNKAIGNMLLGTGKSLWYVGNSIADATAVRVYSSFPSGSTLETIGSLSSTPQLAKYNGSRWDSPVQVGLAPQTETAELILTTDATRDALFTGLITGSVSMRLARKRNGTVSIASGISNVITGDEDSFYALIPDYTEDGSDQDDRVWLFYFTFTGFGSQYAHLLFPIEIPESKLDGTDASGWSSVQGNAKIKVISQHASDQNQRKVEIEFNNNDLLTISPFEDYYPAESCKYLSQLGNVMCLVGTGTDATGFDVSFPNNREAYKPEWRDWLPEVPVSIAHSPESGTFWIMGANTTCQARWTGNTQESAPVVLTQASSKYGAIGEAASVSINGNLYMLSKGKTPVRIDQNRNLDAEFGMRVTAALANFDDTTQLGWEESTNTVWFMCGTSAIGYQIDHDIWTAVCDTASDYDTVATFSINGKMYVCWYNPDFPMTPQFETGEWRGNTGAANWVAVSSFQTGKYALALKDIIEAKVITESDEQPHTFTFQAYKNHSQSSANSLFTYSVTATGVSISPRIIDVESLDYDTISVRASGTKGGQTVHAVNLIVDAHQIERGN